MPLHVPQMRRNAQKRGRPDHAHGSVAIAYVLNTCVENQDI